MSLEFELVSNMTKKRKVIRARVDDEGDEGRAEQTAKAPACETESVDEKAPSDGFPAKKRVKVDEPKEPCGAQLMGVDQFMQRLSAAELDENRKLCECQHESHEVFGFHMCMNLWDVVPFCSYCMENHQAFEQAHRDDTTSPVSIASPLSPQPQDGVQRVGSNWI